MNPLVSLDNLASVAISKENRYDQDAVIKRLKELASRHPQQSSRNDTTEQEYRCIQDEVCRLSINMAQEQGSREQTLLQFENYMSREEPTLIPAIDSSEACRRIKIDLAKDMVDITEHATHPAEPIQRLDNAPIDLCSYRKNMEASNNTKDTKTTPIKELKSFFARSSTFHIKID